VGVVMWTGYAGPGWAWLKKPLAVSLIFELLPQLRKEGSSAKSVGALRFGQVPKCMI